MRRSFVMGVAVAAYPMSALAQPLLTNTLMDQIGQLTWVASPQEFGKREQVYFFIFDLGWDLQWGLHDIDGHLITEWKNMRAPSEDAVARLQVPSGVTMAQLQAAIRELSTKGGYRLIDVSLER